MHNRRFRLGGDPKACSEEHHQREEDEEVKALHTVGNDGAVYHKEAGSDRKSGQKESLYEAQILLLDHDRYEHRYVESVKGDDNYFIGFPVEPNGNIGGFHDKTVPEAELPIEKP